MPRRGSRVFVILPTLNEVENITDVVNGICKELADVPHTVCIIDDGSTDGTIERIHSMIADNANSLVLIQRRKTLRGSQRGSALKVGVERGLQHTEHTIFVEMDADSSHRPEELKRGIRLVQEEGYNVAIGSKYVAGSSVLNRPLGRRLLSWICSVAVGCLITSKIKDYSNGYRFYHRAAAQLLSDHKLKYSSPIYLTEALALWLNTGMSVVEFPTTYVGRNEGLSKLRYIDLLKASLAVFEISLRYHVRGFEKRASIASASPGLRHSLRGH